MTDYTELVKNLRFCASVATALDCDGCEWKGGKYSGLKDKDGAFLDCEEQIKLEAADAIEELMRFAHFVAQEVVGSDEEWENNELTFPEIASRKLHKIGFVEKDGAFWHYEPPKEETE